MKCNQIERKLFFYLEDSLSDNMKNEISNHLIYCPDCKAKLIFIQNSLQIIENERSIEVTPFLYTRITARMDKKKSIVLPQRFMIPFAAASVLTLGLFIGAILGNITTQQSENIVPTEYSVETLFNDSELELTENLLLNE